MSKVFLWLNIINFSFFISSISQGQTQYLGIPVVVDECEDCLDPDNYTYTGEYTFTTQDVVSDFGPRMICSHNFHGGIDYTVTENGVEDQGYHIKALEGGTVYRIGTSGAKYILIEGDTDHNFSYFHLFTDSHLPIRSGDMSMENLSSFGPPNTQPIYQPCIIHYKVDNGVTDTLIYAACPNNDCSNSYKVFSNNDTIYATNQINESDVIGLLGTSGNVASHLHLQKHNILDGITGFETFNKEKLSDPLEFLQHQGPEYDVTILQEGQSTIVDSFPEGVKISYPGIKASSFIVRQTMPDSTPLGNVNHGEGPNKYFYENTMNINSVKAVLLHPSWDTASVICGPTYESRASLGGTEEDLMPYPTSPRSILSNGEYNGNWGRTGFDSRAYNTSCGTNYARQWDDFYFADFVTRIHKSDSIGDDIIEYADVPSHSRYKDGPYAFSARVINVRNDTFETAEDLLDTLDNFYPHITEVSTEISGEDVSYRPVFAHDPSSMTIDDGYIYAGSYNPFPIDLPPTPPLGHELKIEVQTSEPMDTL